jgi:hypothetical protein
VIQAATDGPTRPGRVEPMMIRRTGLVTQYLRR